MFNTPLKLYPCLDETAYDKFISIIAIFLSDSKTPTIYLKSNYLRFSDLINVLNRPNVICF